MIISEQIVTFETAKLAKEKGFNAMVYNCYNSNGNLYSDGYCEYIDDRPSSLGMPFENDDLRSEGILSPTQALLQKWLREKYKIHITIFSSSQESWMFRVTELHQDLTEGSYGEDFETFEDALEAALEKGLDKVENN